MADGFVARHGSDSADSQGWRDFQAINVWHPASVAWSLTLKNPRVT
jgi:hypothetical protein